MSRVLLLSNGHGEDLSGSLLALGLLARGVAVEALPLVGHGGPYRKAGVPLLGGTREFSTGGLGYTSLGGRLTELMQGQLTYTLARAWRLWRHRHRFDLVLAVGDVVPLIGAWLSGRPWAIYLVAYSSHYEGRLRLPWPSGALLRHRRCRDVWSRDALTATDLSQQLGRPVRFLGNPFLDPVAGPNPTAPASPTPASTATASTATASSVTASSATASEATAAAPPEHRPGIGLLPGSRLPEAAANLALMLAVLPRLPQDLRQPGALRLQAALVGGLDAGSVERLAAPLGWRLSPADPASADRARVLRWGDLALELVWNGFSDVLASSDLLLAMAGTAAEQAVGLGRPVLQLVGRGPQFTEGFAEAQRRLLGPGVVCAEEAPGSEAALVATAALAASLLRRLADPTAGPAWRQELSRLGAERIGTPGGSARMAAAIMELLPTPTTRHG